jgi:TonB family protein
MKRFVLLSFAFAGLAACSSAGVPSSAGDVTPGTAVGTGRRCRPSAAPLSNLQADTVVTGEAPFLYSRIRPTPVAPRYPVDEKQQGVEGRVLASFVIDTLGRVVPGSESIARETARGFGDAVCAYLRAARFIPLESNGRRVSVELRNQLTIFALTR